MPRRVDDHLLPLERGVEVRHDAYAPARRVARVALRQRQRLGRGAILTALAEGAGLELLRGGVLDLRHADAGPPGPSGRDHDLATGERIDADLAGHGGAL